MDDGGGVDVVCRTRWTRETITNDDDDNDCLPARSGVRFGSLVVVVLWISVFLSTFIANLV